MGVFDMWRSMSFVVLPRAVPHSIRFAIPPSHITVTHLVFYPNLFHFSSLFFPCLALCAVSPCFSLPLFGNMPACTCFIPVPHFLPSFVFSFGPCGCCSFLAHVRVSSHFDPSSHLALASCSSLCYASSDPLLRTLFLRMLPTSSAFPFFVGLSLQCGY
jgi:hypothetical protein